jgi:hypothetical protein
MSFGGRKLISKINFRPPKMNPLPDRVLAQISSYDDILSSRMRRINRSMSTLPDRKQVLVNRLHEILDDVVEFMDIAQSQTDDIEYSNKVFKISYIGKWFTISGKNPKVSISMLSLAEIIYFSRRIQFDAQDTILFNSKYVDQWDPTTSFVFPHILARSILIPVKERNDTIANLYLLGDLISWSDYIKPKHLSAHETIFDNLDSAKQGYIDSLKQIIHQSQSTRELALIFKIMQLCLKPTTSLSKVMINYNVIIPSLDKTTQRLGVKLFTGRNIEQLEKYFDDIVGIHFAQDASLFLFE